MAAVTPEQIAAAQQAEADAEAALAAAQQEQQQVLSDPKTMATQGDRAEAKVAAARDALRIAQRKHSAILVQARNESTKPLNPLQQENLTRLQALQAQRDKNEKDPNFGLAVTDKERVDIDARNKPKPVSPVQQQQANTAATRATNQATRDAERTETERIQARIEALNKAGILVKDVRGQVSAEAKERVESTQNNIKMVGEAGRSILSNLTEQRSQDASMRNQRSQFIGNILTTALPQVAQMMMKLPKGSAAASNFLKAFLVMANMAYQSAGLDKDLPPVDMNTPEMQNLKKIAGYQLPDKLPEFPTSDQISWRTTKQLAAMGMPPPGYNGPMGAAALDLPDDPGTKKQYGGQLTDQDLQTEVYNSPEIQAAMQAAEAQYPELSRKLRNGEALSPEEEQTRNQINSSLQAQVQERVDKLREQRKLDQEAMSNPDYQLKKELRGVLEGGDSNAKLNLMSSAVVGLQNRMEGKPLTEDQRIVLDTLDPEDVAAIQQNFTPDVAALIQKHASGQKLTDMETKYVASRVNAITAAVKSRPISPPKPKAQQAVAAPEVATPPTTPQAPSTLPTPLFAPTPAPTGEATNQSQATTPESQAKMMVESSQGGLTPDEIAMRKQVLSEKTANGVTQGTPASWDEEARTRIARGEKAKPEFYQPTGKELIQSKPKETVPDLTGMFNPSSTRSDTSLFSPTPVDNYDMGGRIEPSPSPYKPSEIPILNPSMFNFGFNSNDDEEENDIQQPSSLFTPSFGLFA